MAGIDAEAFLKGNIPNIGGGSSEFNTNIALQELAQGQDILGAIGGGFGLPSCLLNLTEGLLDLLPTPVLASIQASILYAKNLANDFISRFMNFIFEKTGILEFDSDLGLVRLKSDNELLTGIADIIGLIQAVASFAGTLYANILDIAQQIDEIADCLQSLRSTEAYKHGASNNDDYNLSTEERLQLYESRFGAAAESLYYTREFVNRCDKVLSDIDKILAARALNPDLEPCFSDSKELDEVLANTTFKRCSPKDPGLPTGEVFRLTYGPPVTSNGQYVLTSDGLYYDSRSGGLDPIYLSISGIIPPGDKWKYDYDPNLGGKGDAISIKSLNTFTDNIFDITRIDDSVGLQQYYDKDHFLLTLKQQREKNLYDLSSQLTEYITTYGEDSSVVKNQRLLIQSEIFNYNTKINKRKKQIEIFVKVPQIYADSSEAVVTPGKVPINDFSLLEKYNLEVDLEKQKALTLTHADVVGIVLPIDPKYSQSSAKAPSIGFSHLYVPKIGKGSMVYEPSGTSSAKVLSLTDELVTDGLFAIYNFLDTTVTLPSSTNFNSLNCASQDTYNNAQLISTNPSNVYFSGISIPYFEGLVKNKSSFPQGASALGSVLRLPDTPEFNNLAYSRSGFTMECWVHVPNIMDAETGWLSGTTSSLTKVLLANENVGVASGVTSTDHLGNIRDLDFLDNDKSSSYVRGLVCGFTRDRRITQESVGYSNDNADNDPVSSLSFFLAPTRSRDASSLSWINNDECQDFESFYKMKVDLSANELIGNVSSQFVLIDISVDPDANAITFYADGQVIATSSITDVFGVDIGQSLNVPSFKKPNSFEYSEDTVDGPSTLKTGPKLDPFYTPWIVGGGWTDGMYASGNFMGGDRGGVVSGLRGHVGSLKFYSKPLDTDEVLKNYNAQKGLFKNIQV